MFSGSVVLQSISSGYRAAKRVAASVAADAKTQAWEEVLSKCSPTRGNESVQGSPQSTLRVHL